MKHNKAEYPFRLLKKLTDLFEDESVSKPEFAKLLEHLLDDEGDCILRGAIGYLEKEAEIRVKLATRIRHDRAFSEALSAPLDVSDDLDSWALAARSVVADIKATLRVDPRRVLMGRVSTLESIRTVQF